MKNKSRCTVVPVVFNSKWFPDSFILFSTLVSATLGFSEVYSKSEVIFLDYGGIRGGEINRD